MENGRPWLRGWMPSSGALMVLLRSRTPYALPYPLPTNPPCKPISPQQPFLAQPLACTPAPPSMLHPTNASDAMVVDHTCAPRVVHTCFCYGQAGHMVRECPLLDMRPQI